MCAVVTSPQTYPESRSRTEVEWTTTGVPEVGSPSVGIQNPDTYRRGESQDSYGNGSSGAGEGDNNKGEGTEKSSLSYRDREVVVTTAVARQFPTAHCRSFYSFCLY